MWLRLFCITLTLVLRCSASTQPQASTFVQRLHLILFRGEVTNAVQGTPVVERTVCPIGVLLVNAPNSFQPPKVRVIRACVGEVHRHDQGALDQLRAACRKEVKEGLAEAWALVESVWDPKPEEGVCQESMRISYTHRGGYSTQETSRYRIGPAQKLELGERIGERTERMSGRAKQGEP
ncbi:MAG TPA: hypothetical protein P5186_04565 [Candidatus Paceibacterota bacterium]|nr:hypothetical protein [Candidatus Paceibacterota bacterium]